MMNARQLSLRKQIALSSERAGVQAFWIVTFALLTAVGAQIEIPIHPVPFTLQTFFVLLAGGLLSKRNAFLSMTLYLILGTAGLPVFSSAGFGLSRLVGPTGGYLISFPIAAFLISYLLSLRPSESDGRMSSVQTLVKGYGWTIGAMALGLVIVFLAGTIHLNLVYMHDWGSALRSGFLVFSLWDVLKLLAAAAITQQFVRR
ncbi:MAG: biotin transporter BioY [Ignavibacteria bacterium]|nr:biotin transporter BioY [Ignavibacteria bacterium]